jgi:hypothetical protein
MCDDLSGNIENFNFRNLKKEKKSSFVKKRNGKINSNNFPPILGFQSFVPNMKKNERTLLFRDRVIRL